MFLRRRIRRLRKRAEAIWTKGLADAAPEKSTYMTPGGPERYAYKAAIEAALEGDPSRYLPLNVWTRVLAEDAKGW